MKANQKFPNGEYLLTSKNVSFKVSRERIISRSLLLMVQSESGE